MTTYPIPAGAVVLTTPTCRHPDTDELVAAVVASPQPPNIAQTGGAWPFIRTADGTERQFRPPAPAPEVVPPPKPLISSKRVVLMLTTLLGGQENFMALWANPAMEYFKVLLSVPGDISYDDPAVEDGLDALVDAEVIAPEGKTAFYALWPAA